jgi:hypothetical protein
MVERMKDMYIYILFKYSTKPLESFKTTALLIIFAQKTTSCFYTLYLKGTGPRDRKYFDKTVQLYVTKKFYRGSSKFLSTIEIPWRKCKMYADSLRLSALFLTITKQCGVFFP